MFPFYWCLNRNLRRKNYRKILFSIFTEKMTTFNFYGTLAEIFLLVKLLQLSIQVLHFCEEPLPVWSLWIFWNFTTNKAWTALKNVVLSICNRIAYTDVSFYQNLFWNIVTVMLIWKRAGMHFRLIGITECSTHSCIMIDTYLISWMRKELIALENACCKRAASA